MKLGIRTAATFSAATLLAGGVLAAATSAAAASSSSLISITKLSSSYGSTTGGTNVLITGAGFNRIDPKIKGSVLFGTKPASSFMVISDTQISATAPAGTGTALQVKVTDGSNDSPDTTSDDWNYLAPVKVTAPAGTELSAAGGTVVRLTVSGPGTIGATSAAFTTNKVTATVDGAAGKLAYVDATHVDLTTPAGVATKKGAKVPVVVLVQGVAGPADVTNVRYDAVVTKLSAVTGKVTGTTGTTSAPALTITGVGLGTATGFTFGKTKGTCTAVSSKSGSAVSSWTCVNIPAGPLGTISVLPVFSDGTKPGVTAGAAYTYTNL